MRIEFPAPAKFVAIVLRVDFAGERVPHVLDVIDSAIRIPFLFEWQDRQQQIDVALDTARA